MSPNVYSMIIGHERLKLSELRGVTKLASFKYITSQNTSFQNIPFENVLKQIRDRRMPELGHFKNVVVLSRDKSS